MSLWLCVVMLNVTVIFYSSSKSHCHSACYHNRAAEAAWSSVDQAALFSGWGAPTRHKASNLQANSPKLEISKAASLSKRHIWYQAPSEKAEVVRQTTSGHYLPSLVTTISANTVCYTNSYWPMRVYGLFSAEQWLSQPVSIGHFILFFSVSDYNS